MKISTQCRLISVLILAAVFATIPSAVRAQNSGQSWSTVATAGEVDESSQSIVDYNLSIAAIKDSAPTTSTATIRYRVAPVDGLFFTGCKALKVRFRDDGTGAEIRVYLRRVDINTGTTSTPLTFDSNSFPAMAGFQTQYGSCVPLTFDFGLGTYWIEAIISRSLHPGGVRGNPGLQVIQITTIVI